jgi:hypothetical protein
LRTYKENKDEYEKTKKTTDKESIDINKIKGKNI